MKKFWSLLLCLALALGMTVHMPVAAEAKALSKGSCGSGVAYSFDSKTGTLTIRGKGSMADYGPKQNKSPFSGRNEILSVVIEDGVKSVGEWAFYDCYKLQSASFGKDMKTISYCAFYGCVGLADMTMQPDSVTFIGGSAFAHCQALDTITIPDTVADIGYQAFDDTGYYHNMDNWEDKVLYIGHCLYSGLYNTVYKSNNKGDKTKPYVSGVVVPSTSPKVSGHYDIKEGTTLIASGAFLFTQLAGVTIPNSVVKIGWEAFEYTDIEEVTIPDSVTRIGGSAFCGCNSLKKVTLSKNLTELGPRAFHSCSKLTTITIPKRVMIIEDETFARSGLKKITIPKTVKAIGNSAFHSCGSLKKVTIASGVRSVGEEAFYGCGSLKSVTVPKSVKTIGRHAFGYKLDVQLKGFKLKGYKGSAAQKYAKNNKIKFSVITKK